MAAKTRVVINYAGVGELLRSEWAAGICTEVAAGIAARAGDGYEMASPHSTGQRMAVNVYAATKDAVKDNLENNTLLTSLGG